MAPSKLVAVAAVAASIAGGTWTAAPSLPSPRSAHAVTVAGGAIYVLGGPGTRNVDRFDGHVWRTVSTLPGATLNAPAAVTLAGRVFVIGGFEGASNIPTAAVHVFDPASRKWSLSRPLPAPRGGHSAVVLDGKIHVLGGGNDVSTLAEHLVFDPKTNAWTRLAPLPRSEGSVAAVVFRGRIYAIGGRSGFDDYGDTFVYDAGRTAGPRPSHPAAWNRRRGRVRQRDLRLRRRVAAEERRARRRVPPRARAPLGGNASGALRPRPELRARGRVPASDLRRRRQPTAGDVHGTPGSRIVERYVP